MIKKTLLVALCILVLITLSACSNQDPNIVKITGDGSFTVEECRNRGFQDKVIMFESKYCSHCQKTIPDFIAACEEHNVSPTILDLSEAEDMAQYESYDIEIVGTPTFIFGCNYIVGVKEKEDYLSYLEAFKTSKV